MWVVVPGAYLAALWPTIRPAVRPGTWAPVFLVAGGSAAVALAVELTGRTPTSLADPVLWLVALPCFALLGLGAWTTRPPRDP